MPSSRVSGDRPASRMSRSASSGRTLREPPPRSTSIARYTGASGSFDRVDRHERVEIFGRHLSEDNLSPSTFDVCGGDRHGDDLP